ncbi:MAG TPA: hypothetical protein VFZ65_23850 [Planctomycetota bacterium]|nr:hypothetical protein [Planctomycetota bacterium]
MEHALSVAHHEPDAAHPAPGITLGPGLLCSTGSFYGVPAVVADAMGSPGLLQFPLPLSLAGQGFVVQGVALAPALCLRLSDPLAATIQLP